MTQKELKIIDYQKISSDEFKIFNSEDCDNTISIIKIYLYGIMQGKDRNEIEEKNQQINLNICYNIKKYIKDCLKWERL